MSKFANAIKYIENTCTTENGRPALKSTGSHLLDFFYTAASLRKNFSDYSTKRIKKNGKFMITNTISNKQAWERSAECKQALNLFFNAFEEEPVLAMTTLFWLRDIRGGAGERQIFRTIYNAALNDERTKAAALSVSNLISEYGRWDDLWACLDPFDPTYERILAYIIKEAIGNPEKSRLIAKWLPREKGNNIRLARRMAQIIGLRNSTYRYTNSMNACNTVERAMSAGKWNEIVFEHVPSVAMARYTNAFNKNARDAFMKYKQGLVKEERKINASAIFPYEIIKNLNESQDDVLATYQWKALPNYIQEGMTILPMVDVSGSMNVKIAKGVSAMDVAISLGMYCAERQSGPFKDLFLTFSNNPEFVNLARFGSSLSAREKGMSRADWEMNTNIDSAMRKILNTAKAAKCEQKDLPNVLYILTDGQFDSMVLNGRQNTFLKDAKRMFAQDGYEMPHVIFHNLNGSYKNTPCDFSAPGVSLVSGFSPTIMKSILSGKQINPLDQMLEVILSERYHPVIEGVLQVYT